MMREYFYKIKNKNKIIEDAMLKGPVEKGLEL
jgi:hypothetical protein